MPKIERALISVFDKTGLIPFAETLAAAGVEIISTGGTAKALKERGIRVIELSAHTGFPEMLDGRVKTLHPKIHGGLLYLRDNPEHVATVESELRAWLIEREYESVAQMRGSASQATVEDPSAFERANYMQTLRSWVAPER